MGKRCKIHISGNKSVLFSTFKGFVVENAENRKSLNNLAVILFFYKTYRKEKLEKL